MRGFSVGSTLLTAVLLAGTALAQAPSGKLVLYTSQPQKDAQETIAAFTKAVPGVQVDFVRDGTTVVRCYIGADRTCSIWPGAPLLRISMKPGGSNPAARLFSLER